MMEYKKIQPKKIYEQVASTLMEMIRSGKLKPGDKLASVQQLAENFSVSRSAVREALTSLRAMGLIELKQGEGTFVRAFEPSLLNFPIVQAMLMNRGDIMNLLEVRKILETGAVAVAAKKRTSEDLMKMRGALKEMEAAAGDEVLAEKADLAFHLAISQASHNPLLVGLMNHVSDLIDMSMKDTHRILLFTDDSDFSTLYDQHMRIYHAIEKQDADDARKELLSHLEEVEAKVVQ